ncbi:ATP-binding cassette domain-containing protein, partial [Streptomyces mirabilis]|uniref:ATP-binding cassette domain-containing protein n=1 Tax=Streptomyces mirabilis TaxID=68239 RepID=UPI00369DFAFD
MLVLSLPSADSASESRRASRKREDGTGRNETTGFARVRGGACHAFDRRDEGEARMSQGVLATGLVKRYGGTTAVAGLDLAVPEGTVLGLLGPNGAGKTTTVRMLSTLQAPDAGECTIAGVDIVRHPQKARKLLGLSGQYAAVDEFLTGYENLEMVGRLHRLGKTRARGRGGGRVGAPLAGNGRTARCARPDKRPPCSIHSAARAPRRLEPRRRRPKSCDSAAALAPRCAIIGRARSGASRPAQARRSRKAWPDSPAPDEDPSRMRPLPPLRLPAAAPSRLRGAPSAP